MNKVIAVVLSADAGSFKSQMLVASGAVKDFEHAADSGGGTASKFGLAAKAAAAGVALAFAAAAVATISMAADFDRAMRNVNSISQLSEQQFGSLEQSVLDLSKAVPQSATSLAEGLYDIASSGFQGAEGVKVLDASARAATAGLSDTKTSAAALVGVLNAYGFSADQAAAVSDVLFQTVNVGVLSFADLAQGLGDVVGVGAAAHVSIQELGGAVAAMTLAAIKPAEAFTSLNRVIQAFIKPSDELTNLMHNMGFESAYAALQGLGLHGVIERIRKETGGSAEAMVKLFGDIRAARGAFALMSNDGANYNRAIQAVTDQTLVAGATQRAFTEQMKSLSNQWDLFVNKIQAGAIEVGVKAIPLLVRGIGDMQTGGQKLVDFAQAAVAALGPFFSGLGITAQHLGAILRDVAIAAAPIAGLLAAIAGSGVVTFLNTLGTVLGAVAGFLDHNRFIVEGLLILYGVKLVASLALAGEAFIQKLALGASRAAGSLGEAATTGNMLAAGLAVGVAGLYQFGQSLNSTALSAQDLHSQLERLNADQVAQALDKMKQASGDAGSEFDIFGETLKQLASSGAAGIGVLREYRTHLVAMGQDTSAVDKVLSDAAAAEKNLADNADAGKSSVDGLGTAAGGTTKTMSELEKMMQSGADAAKAMEQNIKALDDALHAQMDPLFGMLDAVTKNKQALLDAADAHRKYGAASAEAQKADEDAVKSAEDVTSAAIKLAGAVRIGSVTVSQATATLQDWVAQGLITQQQADAIAAKFGDVAAQADALQGKTVDIAINAATEDAEAKLQRLGQMVQKLADGSYTIEVDMAARLTTPRRWGGVVEHAAIGKFRDAGVYDSPTYGIAERGTGGEAFIPKYGHAERSLAILDRAASWYGATVMTARPAFMRAVNHGSSPAGVSVNYAPQILVDAANGDVVGQVSSALRDGHIKLVSELTSALRKSDRVRR